jgi:hypothetical protein
MHLPLLKFFIKVWAVPELKMKLIRFPKDKPPAGMSITLGNGTVIRLSREETANECFQAGWNNHENGYEGRNGKDWNFSAFQIGYWANLVYGGYMDFIPGFTEPEIHRALNPIEKKQPAAVVSICSKRKDGSV